MCMYVCVYISKLMFLRSSSLTLRGFPLHPHSHPSRPSDMCMYAYVCVWVYINMCVYIYVCIYIYMYVHVHVYVFTYIS